MTISSPTGMITLLALRSRHRSGFIVAGLGVANELQLPSVGTRSMLSMTIRPTGAFCESSLSPSS